jgi:hypothetical protein
MKENTFTQIIKIEVLSNDRKQIGHVDGLDDKYLIIKMDSSTPPTIKYLLRGNSSKVYL